MTDSYILPKKRIIVCVGLMGVGVLCDQLLKNWVINTLPLHQVISVIPHVLSLTYLRNEGAAYSLFQERHVLLIVITAVVLMMVAWYLVRHIRDALPLVIGLSLVLTGGIGNLMDRLRLGYVVDMFQLEFVRFPVFNLADGILTLGACSLIIWMIKEG